MNMWRKEVKGEEVVCSRKNSFVCLFEVADELDLLLGLNIGSYLEDLFQH